MSDPKFPILDMWPDLMASAPPVPDEGDGSPRDAERRLWMTRRQAIIMELGAIEDYLDLPRSIVPRRKREHEREERRAS